VIEGKIRSPWHIQHVIDDILPWRSQGIQFNTKHILREANMVADWLSKFGHSLIGSSVTEICFSPTLSKIPDEDVVRRSLVRIGV